MFQSLLDLTPQERRSSLEAVYPGLDLRPQTGLVPIGVDPDSGLHEFWHVLSGEEPERGPDGKLRIGEQTGVVLVLVPGGPTILGASTDPDAWKIVNGKLYVLPFAYELHTGRRLPDWKFKRPGHGCGTFSASNQLELRSW